MTSPVPAHDLVEIALGELPAGSVLFDDATGANLRFAHSSLTTNGHTRSATMTVVAHDERSDGTALGVLSAPVTSAAEAIELARAAVAAAADAAVADDRADLVDAGVAEDWTEGAAPGGIDLVAPITAPLGEQFGGPHAWFGFAESIVTTSWLATTAGTRYRAVDPMGRFEVNVKSRGADPTSVWVGRQVPDFAAVDVAAVAAEADRRIGWSANRIEIPAGRHQTVLPPSAVADLLITAYWEMSRRDALEGRNAYAAGPGRTRVGQRLSDLPLTVSSDPHQAGIECPDRALVRSPQSGAVSPFDNGAGVGRVDWITDGVLTHLYGPRASGDFRFPTDNLIADARATRSLDELVAETDRGLLLTCLWYIREVDPQTMLQTGLTRDGVYVIEGGEVVGQTTNFRFNESPLDMLRRATAASVSEATLCREWNDWFTRTRMPGLSIADFNMSTVSRAS